MAESKIHSTRLADDKLDWTCIFPSNRREKIEEMYIVSAYTDVKIIKKLIKDILNHRRFSQRPKMILKIFLDGNRSHFFDDQETRKELRDIDFTINNSYDSEKTRKEKFFDSSSGLYLIKKGSLFHSKMILVKTDSSERLLIGSLNFTTQAFLKNEELMLVHESSKHYKTEILKQADKYIKKIELLVKQNKPGTFSTGGRVSNIPPNKKIFGENKNEIFKYDSVEDFLSSGILVHQVQTKTLSLYFDLKLPPDVLDKKINESPVHSLLKNTKNNTKSLSLKKIMEECKIPFPQKTEQISWKRFCVETPLGLWCPPKYIPEITALKNSSEKNSFYESLFQILEKKRSIITEKFKEVQSSISQLIKEISDKGEIIDDWDLYGEKGVNAWNTWYDKLLKKQNKSSLMQMLTNVVITSSVPYIWDDPIASKQFIDVFRKSLNDEADIDYGKNVADEILEEYAYLLK